MIHPSAVISPKAQIGSNVKIGPYSVIGDNVVIKDGTEIASHVVIDGYTEIGEGCRIYPFASIGQPPQAFKYRGEKTEIKIGKGNVIREYVTVSPGTAGGGGETTIGDNSYFMINSHIAHDCHIGSEVIMANCATLAGHVIVEDWAIIGGLVAVHQFVRIGKLAMVGGASGVSLDIPPFTSVAGNHTKLYGLNTVGLKRRGFPHDTVTALQKSYRILFRSKMLLKDALEIIEKKYSSVPEVVHLLNFVRSSERGVCRKSGKSG